MRRKSNRKNDELRKIKFIPNYLKYAEGSCFVEDGDTKVVCSVSIEKKVPFFLKGSGTGWLTAEYSMLPRATQKRNVRERTNGRISGRSQEIQRLIGRALRYMVDLKELGEITLYIDCDVIQADGGTRTASINAGAIALALALKKLTFKNHFEKEPIKGLVSAISVGIINGEQRLDLDFNEDSEAEVDLNIVENDKKELIEIQGAGEKRAFTMRELYDLILLAEKGIEKILKLQKEAITKGYEEFIKTI